MLQQEINISLEDVCHVDEPKTKELYHFAMNGKSFAVIEEHFPDMLQKVGSVLNPTERHSERFPVIREEMLKPFWGVLRLRLCLIARAARDSVCQDGARPENPADWGSAGSGVSIEVKHMMLLWKRFLTITQKAFVSPVWPAWYCEPFNHEV